MTPTHASLLDAIRTGSFGGFTFGTCRRTVGETLGEATDASIVDRKRASCIWRYGDIEFHFTNDILTLIHCDSDHLFDGGVTLSVDPWKLRARMPLHELAAVLDGNDLRYTTAIDSYAPDCFIRFDSGFSLGVVLDREAGLGPIGLRSWSIQDGG